MDDMETYENVLRVFAGYGFGKASMAEIASAANVSRQTLYNRFRTKKAVLSWAAAGFTEVCMARALARLAAVNPAAEIRAASFGAVESGWLLRPAPALRAAPEAAAPAHRHDEGEHHHDHRQGEHTHGIVSHFRACDAAVPWPRYAAAVHRVQRALGERALRVKGLLRLGGGGQPHLIQGVKHVFAPPEEIEPPGPYRCGLTFIGLDLGEDEVDAVMAELLPPQA